MKTSVLSGKIALCEAQPKDYTDWAEEQLLAGHESESVVILASLGLDEDPDRWEVETLFSKCLRELSILFEDREKAIKDYSLFLCESISSEVITPQEGLAQLSCFWRQTEYKEPLFSIWDELSEDILSLESRGEYYWNSNLTTENMNEYIRNVAKQFLLLATIDLPVDFFNLSACKHCKSIGLHSIERIEKPLLPQDLFRLLYKRGPTSRCVCAKCGAPYPLRMGDFEARELYFRLHANKSSKPTH